MADTQHIYPIARYPTVDVLVIGGGIAAICAAIAAARNGCETALIEMDAYLGGNSSPLLGVHVSGAHSFHPYASETGIIEEIELEAARQVAKTRTWKYHYNLSQQWDLVLQEKLEGAGVRVYRQHQGRRAIVEGRRIVGAIVEDIERFRTVRFAVRHGVIDGSGDGVVAADAGAAFMWGTESVDAYQERSAPEVASGQTMGTSLTAWVRRCEDPVAFVMPPRFAARAAADEPYEQLGYLWMPEDEECAFMWVTESGGERDTIADAAEIRDEILYQFYRYWDNVKNHSFPKRARNWELTWISPKSGKRESRRFVGDIVLTQTDVERATPFEDSIGYGGYGVDVHEVNEQHPTRIRIVFYSIPPLWDMPYRATYARDFDNLWLAGRLMSVSHLALGTVRLQRTMGAIGQGVGIAVAMAQEFSCTAREIYRHHCQALQQRLLKQDGTILTATNVDPGDLARRASVSATSEMRHGATRVAAYLPLDVPRGVQMWDWASSLHEAQFAIRNTDDRAHQLTLTLSLFARDSLWKDTSEHIPFTHLKTQANRMEWGSDNRVDRTRPIAQAQATVPPQFEGWLTFAFDAPIEMLALDPTSDENRYNLTLHACPGVEIAVDEHHYDFALRLWRPSDGDSYRVEGDCHAFQISPPPRYGEATNAIDGHNRRYATNPVHAWLSDFDAPLPQAIALTMSSPAAISSVQLTFDTIERAYRDAPINCDERYARRCVTDYYVEVQTESGWQRVVEERGNYQRWRVHTFPPVKVHAVRVTVLKVRDPRYKARIYEIRIY